MNFVSVGDLSRFMTMRRGNSGLRNDIQRLSQEVTTGIKADVPKHLQGDLMFLAGIERSLSEASAYRRAGSEAAATASGMQAALGVLHDIADGSSGTMLSDAFLAVDENLQSVARTMADQLEMAVSALNTTSGGRFVFSGTKVNTAAIVSAEELVSQAQSVIAGAATADEAAQLLGDWFDAPPGAGGFSDTGYLGSAGGGSSFGIDASTTVRFEQTANDEGPRKVLLGLMLGALVSQGAFSGDHSARTRLMQAGGAALAEGGAKVVAARADLGMTEQMIERSAARLDSMAANLKIERTNLISADQYEATSQLIQAEAQLDALFAVTARLSSLSLAKYL